MVSSEVYRAVGCLYLVHREANYTNDDDDGDMDDENHPFSHSADPVLPLSAHLRECVSGCH